ncbi:MAG: glycosyltransferase family 4 protein [Bacteroidia bacterium]|nr:glycosyltransferase family 4 protein [Bacteroidia bacterium]MDW8015622.1 glycosyltransferase family 4 protein [Bacteroidia bacterium]
MERSTSGFSLLYWQYFFTPPGGWGNRRSYDFARIWKAEGYDVWILAGGTYFPSSYSGRRVRRTIEGITLIWLPAPYHQRTSWLRRLWSFIRFTLWSAYILWRLRHQRFYLIATLPPPFLPIVAGLRRYLSGLPFSIEVFDAWPDVLRARFPSFVVDSLRLLLQWSYHQADCIFALSPDIASLLPADRTYLSLNGTRIELFYRRKYPSFLPFRIVYAGTLGWVNDVSFLLRVAACLQAYKGIEFWIIGDGAEKPLLERQAQAFPSVKFFKPVPVEDLPHWLSEGHIGVSLVRAVPIFSTNSANKFYDYLANGMVVGINYGGWQAKVLREEKCGFSAQSVEGFAAAILRYYWDRKEWEKAASRARLWAEAHSDRRKLAKAVLETITQQAQGKEQESI